MFEAAIDRDMYDHPGAQTTVTRNIRKYRDRAALAKGQTVTIVRISQSADRYGIVTRVLVDYGTGSRWVASSAIEPIEHNGNRGAYARMGEVASAILSNRD